MLPEQIIFIGVLISLLGTIWYIRTIFTSGTRPNAISWLIWMVAPFVGTFLSIKAGAGFSVLGVFMSGFGPLLVIFFALIKRNAFWKVNYFDVLCGLFSVIALIMYVITKNPNSSIIFAIISDGLAAIPTILKSREHPDSESGSIYFAGIMNNLLALLIIKDWSFAVYSFNAYIVLVNIIIVFAIYRKKIKLILSKIFLKEFCSK